MAASSAFGMRRRHHSKLNMAAEIDVDLWCPFCPLHPYLSLPSRCICKLCTQYGVQTTRTVFFTETCRVHTAITLYSKENCSTSILKPTKEETSLSKGWTDKVVHQDGLYVSIKMEQECLFLQTPF